MSARQAQQLGGFALFAIGSSDLLTAHHAPWWWVELAVTILGQLLILLGVKLWRPL